MSYLIEELRERKTLDNQGLKALLESDDPSLEDELFRNAREVADGQFGHEIWLRALIEWSNVCRNDCYYCGNKYVRAEFAAIAITHNIKKMVSQLKGTA